MLQREESATKRTQLTSRAEVAQPFIYARAPVMVSAVFVLQLFLGLAIVPPWQNPDEPQHISTVHRIMRFGPDFALDMADPDGERELIASMARYGWWQHYGLEVPQPLPSSFEEGPAKVVEDYFGPLGGGSRLYYRSMATSFRQFGLTDTNDLLAQLYTMRILSAIAGLLTVWCVWAGTRRLLDDLSALVVACVMALHPQFVLVSTSASPDALVNLAGAAVWWQAAVLLTSPRSFSAILLLIATAMAALLTRRLGATLIIIVAGVLAAAAVKRVTEWRVRWSTGSVVALVAVLALSGAVVDVLLPDLLRALTWSRFDAPEAMSTLLNDNTGLWTFLQMLFRSSWLSAGWLRYGPPEWWRAVILGITMITAAGLLVAFYRHPSSRGPIALAAAMVAVQLIAVVAYHFGIRHSGAQGRYLFPVLPAVLCLAYVGWAAILGGERRRTFSALCLIALVAFLNLTGWALVILPAYA